MKPYYYYLSLALGLFLAYCTQDRPSKITMLHINAPRTQWNTEEFKFGDIVFQSSHSAQSMAIALATHSNLTHCGIILPTDTGIVVLEAVQPVKLTKWKEWKQRGLNQAFSVYRLKERIDLDEKEAWRRMVDFIAENLNKNYDPSFMWDDNEMYCSELVWKCYKKCFERSVADMKVLGDYDLKSPIVAAVMEERYGKNIPYDEPMVAPVSIAQNENLVRIGGSLQSELTN